MPGWGGVGAKKARVQNTRCPVQEEDLAAQGSVDSTCRASCRAGFPCTGAGLLQDREVGKVLP